jgi:small-conductance mechanosensitive channel
MGNWRDWLWALGIGAGTVVVALVAHRVFFALARRLARRQRGAFYSLLVERQERPSRVFLPLLALLPVLPWLPLPARFLPTISHAVGLGLIAAIAWLMIALLDTVQEFVSLRHAIELADNLAARRLKTQVQVLRHIMATVIILVAVAVMLMTFPSIRHLGESLFASAGLVALVAGLAARTTLTSLLAGVQIALTQPIRIEDVVIVEGEWGWIEEITMTYVIVRVWDLRRLVVPLTYFIEKPFQNWTRQSADLLGTVFVYADYTVPVDAVREELHRVLESSKLWDGKVWGLQVTNASEHTLELRALMSSANASAAFDLRCYVREKLVQFLQQHHSQSLPRTRADVTGIVPSRSQENGLNSVKDAA